MNAPIFISPAVSRLDKAQEERAAALSQDERPAVPPVPAGAYRDIQPICNYQGMTLFLLPSMGLIHTHETGCHWTIEEAKAAIDKWLDDRVPPGWEAAF